MICIAMLSFSVDSSLAMISLAAFANCDTGSRILLLGLGAIGLLKCSKFACGDVVIASLLGMFYRDVNVWKVLISDNIKILLLRKKWNIWLVKYNI